MRSVLRILPMVLVGGLAAVLLVGPLSRLGLGHLLAGRPPTSTSSLHSPAGSPLAAPAGLPLTGPSGSGCALPPRPERVVRAGNTAALTLPVRLWVNDPLGVNLRAAPGVAAERIGLLSQGTAVNAVEGSADASGALWYRVNGLEGGAQGWVMGAFLVATPVRLTVSSDGWQALLPEGYRVAEPAPYHTEVRTPTGGDYPFLWVKTEFTTGGNPPPDSIRWDVAPIFDHTRQVQVWNYTVLSNVSRYPINTCKVQLSQDRADGGWPWVTSLSVRTPSHSYQFLFFAAEPDSPVVTQVLGSLLFS